MFLAIPFMFLVPAGVIAILVMALEELLYPSKLWKCMSAVAGALLIASAVMPRAGINEKYGFGVTLIIMTVLLLTQSWRWLTPFWIFFIVSVLALAIVYSVGCAALGLDPVKQQY